jgi:hypothetical protein
MGDRRLYGYLFLLEVLSFPLIFRGCGYFRLILGSIAVETARHLRHSRDLLKKFLLNQE